MSFITTTTKITTKSKFLNNNNPIFPWSKTRLLVNDNDLFPRYGHSSCSNAIKDELYFFGGISNGKFNNDLFLMETNTFTVQFIKTTGSIPPPRSDHVHERVGSKLIVFGGQLENIEEKPDYNLYVLNIATREWTKPSIKGVTPLGRFGHTAVSIGSVMYVFGGCIDGYYPNDLVAFDTKFLSSNKACWEFINPINEPPPGRTGHISCAHKGKIYIFGGTDGEKCYNDTWYYDIETKAWRELTFDTFIPVPRESHGCTLVNDVMYVFGGRTKEGKELADLAAYGISNKRWYMFQKMGPSPGPRYWLTVSSSKDMVMIFGGESTNSTNPDEEGLIHILDTSKIKYPIETYVDNFSSTGRLSPSRLQIVLSTFPQQKSLPKLRQQPTINYGKDIIIDNLENHSYHISKIELKARNPDIKAPSTRTLSRPSSSRNINILTTTTHGCSMIDSKKSFERIKKSKISPQKDLYSDKEQEGQSRNIKQKNKIIPDEDPKLIKALEKSILQRQNSVETVRSLSSPSLRPRGARKLDKKNQVKLKKLENIEVSSSNSSNNPMIPIRSTQANLDAIIPALPLTIKIASPEQEIESVPVRPPRRRSETTLTINTKSIEREEKDSPVKPTPPSTRSPNFEREVSVTSSEGEHYPTTQLSSLERENFLERLSEADFKISELRKREKLYQAEIDLARKAGFIPTFSFSDDKNDDIENIIDINEFIDIGEPGSEKFKVIEAIIKLSQQLQKAKETIANQERVATQKISDFERLYTASLEETAYFKAKFAALMNEYETERLARAAGEVEEMKLQLNEKTQKLEKSTKDVDVAKNQVEIIREFISDKINLEPNDQGIISSRFKEIAARCDELESLHEIAHKELQASLLKYKESVKNVQETLSSSNGLEIELKSAKNTTLKSQEQLVDIKNRISQVESDYQIAVEYTTSTEQILNKMKEELAQSKLEMENLNEKLINVENHNEELENKLREIQSTMNSHSDIRNSILQEFASQQLDEQQMNFEKEKDHLYQKIQELQYKINLAQDEKSLMYQGYETLRRIYESLKQQNEVLKKSNEMLKNKSLESGKKGEELGNELMIRAIEFNRQQEEKDLETILEENQEDQEDQEDIEQWEQERKLLEQEISQYQESNENLEKNNLELKKNVNETESKIATLLDQMESAVDTYRGIEDNIRDGSPALIGPIIRNNISSSSLSKDLDSNSDDSNYSLD